MTPLAMMARLADLGIVLKSSGDRLRFYPRSAVTPELAAELKRHKGELLALLRSWHNVAQIQETSYNGTATDKAAATKVVCRCGSTGWRDVPIHDGQSVRRDCDRCGRFLDFLVWYGKDTLHGEQ